MTEYAIDKGRCALFKYELRFGEIYYIAKPLKFITYYALYAGVFLFIITYCHFSFPSLWDVGSPEACFGSVWRHQVCVIICDICTGIEVHSRKSYRIYKIESVCIKCVSVCVSVCQHRICRAITHHLFKLGSPNMDVKTWLRYFCHLVEWLILIEIKSQNLVLWLSIYNPL